MITMPKNLLLEVIIVNVPFSQGNGLQRFRSKFYMATYVKSDIKLKVSFKKILHKSEVKRSLCTKSSFSKLTSLIV